MFLSNKVMFLGQVHLLVRGPKMRASAAMQDRVLEHEKVEVHYNTMVDDAYGDKKGLKGLVLKDTSNGEELLTLRYCTSSLYKDALIPHMRCLARLSCSEIESKLACAGEDRKLDVRGLFYGIGHQPNSHIIEGQVELDDKGYVKVSITFLRFGYQNRIGCTGVARCH